VGPWMAGLAPAPDAIEEFAGDRYLDPGRSFANAH
jgi:hypothetical protein